VKRVSERPLGGENGNVDGINLWEAGGLTYGVLRGFGLKREQKVTKREQKDKNHLFSDLPTP